MQRFRQTPEGVITEIFDQCKWSGLRSVWRNVKQF
jgi:hypothetical protein